MALKPLTDIPPRLRRNYLFAQLDFVLNESLESVTFLTEEFVAQTYNEIFPVPLEDDLEYFGTDLLDVIEKNFPQTTFTVVRTGLRGILRNKNINQPIASATSPSLDTPAHVTGITESPTIQYLDTLKNASVPNRTSNPNRSTDEESVEPETKSSFGSNSASDADSAYSTSEMHQVILQKQRTESLPSSDSRENANVSKYHAQISPTKSFELESFSHMSYNDAQVLPTFIACNHINAPAVATTSQICMPTPPGFDTQVLAKKLLNITSPPEELRGKGKTSQREQLADDNLNHYGNMNMDSEEAYISNEERIDKNYASSHQIMDLEAIIKSDYLKLVSDSDSQRLGKSGAPGFGRTDLRNTDETMSPRDTDEDPITENDNPDDIPSQSTTKDPLYLGLLVGVPPPGCHATKPKPLYSSMARKSKESNEGDLFDLLEQVSHAKEEVLSAFRSQNAQDSLRPCYSKNLNDLTSVSVDSGVGISFGRFDCPTLESESNYADIGHNQEQSSSELHNSFYEFEFEFDEEFNADGKQSCAFKNSQKVTMEAEKNSTLSIAIDVPYVPIPVPCNIHLGNEQIPHYYLHHRFVENYEEASAYRNALVKNINSTIMDVDWIVSEWAAQFPNINTIVEVLCAMKEEFPKGCTTEELCTFDQEIRARQRNERLNQFPWSFEYLFESCMIFMENDRLKVSKEISFPNFIFLRKNFVSNFYRLLHSMGGSAKIKDLIPSLKFTIPKNSSCSPVDILHICNRYPLLFTLETHSDIDGRLFEQAQVHLNELIPEWRIILDCDRTVMGGILCDCCACNPNIINR
ncbi:hypothetical protein DdX_02663 [Ditylenchus destructor]|uniref:Uncharacterized protein n=1 Tax=Ditylenchus destructor TaxID=166010 RepID=A0AAD4R688_9BILA|nr:hypothetical protein DdX_02663 [Ditylenchus destructor]